MVRLIFFTSPIGLGHASRDIAIADELVGSGTGRDEILFATGGVAYSYIRDHGYNVVEAYRGKSIDATGGVFRHRLLWLLDYISFYRECKGKALSIIEEYRPELIVSDEDFASASVARTAGIRTVLITDIFESRFLTGLPSILEKVLNRYLGDIMAGADAVIVPMHEDECRCKMHGSSNVVHTGPIVRRASSSRDELRRALGFDGYRVILTAVGGTTSGRFLLERAVDAYMNIADSLNSRLGIPTKLVVVSGPSIDVQDIKDRCGDGQVEFHGYVRNMHEMVYAADLLISLAGRSTMDEARVYGTPAILIPINGHFEQEENARSMGFSHSDVERLEQLMLEHTACERREAVSSNGASRAAGVILSLTTKY